MEDAYLENIWRTFGFRYIGNIGDVVDELLHFISKF
jgi:hypothetical protein